MEAELNYLTRHWTDEGFLDYAAKAWFALYNEDTNPNPNPSISALLMKVSLFLKSKLD